MDPITLAMIYQLIRFGLVTAEQYSSGQLTDAEVRQQFANAGIDIDKAKSAWDAAGITASGLAKPAG